MNHQLPSALQAEASLITSILIGDRSTACEIFDLVQHNDFYGPVHRDIFRASHKIHSNGADVDIVLLADELGKVAWRGDVAPAVYLARLMDTQPVATNIKQYAERVKETACRRNLLSICNSVSQKCQQNGSDVTELLGDAQTKIMNLSLENTKGDYFRLSAMLEEAIERYDAMMNQTCDMTGIPTGFSMLDTLTCGFQKTDSIYIAGRPSMGKTALMMSMIRNQLMSGMGAGVFSLEMGRDQLMDRILSGVTEINLMKFRSGKFKQEDMDKITAAASKLSDERLSVDDTGGITVDEIARKAKMMRARDGIDIVYIDYLGLIQHPRSARNTVDGISYITRRLKLLAKDLDIPVVCLCQLNRKLEERQNKRPILSDLRDSGSIEQDADVVAFIYRDEVYNPESKRAGIAEIIVAKQRSGPTRVVELAWVANAARFENL